MNALVTEDGTLVEALSGSPVEGAVGFLANTVLALEPVEGGYRVKGVIGIRASRGEPSAAWRDAMGEKLARLRKRTHWFDKLKQVKKGEQAKSYTATFVRQRAQEVEGEIAAYNDLAEEMGLPLLEDVELPSWT